jgi:hypothetical protein
MSNEDDFETPSEKVAREVLEANGLNDESPDFIMSIKVLRQWLILGADGGFDHMKAAYLENPTKFPKCIVCGRETRKLNQIKLGFSYVSVLRELAHLKFEKEIPWVKLDRDRGNVYIGPDGIDIPSKVPSCNRRAQELKPFGFVDNVKKMLNQWFITDLGVQFLAGKIQAPAYINSRDGGAEEASKEKIWVYEVKNWPKLDWKTWVPHTVFKGQDLDADPVAP